MLTLTSTKIPTRKVQLAHESNMDHWRVTLHYNGKRMSLEYSMGKGFNGASPRLADVLDSCRMDASCPESFADFCAEFGYDTDSIKAMRTHKACLSVKIRLRKLLGPSAQWLLHDGEAVMAGSKIELIDWIHKHHSYSFSHALEHEGYSVEPLA